MSLDPHRDQRQSLYVRLEVWSRARAVSINHRRVCCNCHRHRPGRRSGPRIECLAEPRRLQSLVELGEYVMMAEQCCYADDLACRPHGPVGIPPVSADKLGTVKQIGATALSVGGGRPAEQRDLCLPASVRSTQSLTTHHQGEFQHAVEMPRRLRRPRRLLPLSTWRCPARFRLGLAQLIGITDWRPFNQNRIHASSSAATSLGRPGPR